MKRLTLFLFCALALADPPVRVMRHQDHNRKAEHVFRKIKAGEDLRSKSLTVRAVRVSALSFQVAVQADDRELTRALVEVEYTVDIRSDPPARALRSITAVVYLAPGQLALSDAIGVALENVSGIKVWPLPDEKGTEFWNADIAR